LYANDIKITADIYSKSKMYGCVLWFYKHH